VKDFDQALSYSFLLLKYRARSRHEIEQRLKRKKYSPQVIKKTIGYLEEKKYLNDCDFAAVFTAAALQKGWGPKKIFFTLKKLGLAHELIEKALANKEPFKKKIEALISQRINQCQGRAGYQKMIRFLISRGFSYQDIVSSLEETGLPKNED